MRVIKPKPASASMAGHSDRVPGSGTWYQVVARALAERRVHVFSKHGSSRRSKQGSPRHHRQATLLIADHSMAVAPTP